MPDAIQVATQDVYAFQFKTAAAPNWDDPCEAMGATMGVEPRMPGFAFDPGRGYQPNTSVLGTAGHRSHRKGNVAPPNISPAFDLRFEGQLNLFLAMFFGTEARSNITEGTTTVGQQFLFTMHDTCLEVNGCAAKRGKSFDGSSTTNLITEVDSFKVDQLVINWTQGQVPTMTPTLFMRRVYVEGDSGIVNTNTELAAVTMEGSDADDADNEAVQVRINAVGGSALGAGDIVDVRGLTLTLQRAYGDADPSNVSAPHRLEPIPTAGDGAGFLVTLQLQLADAGRTYLKGHRDITKYKADVTFSGGLLVGAATEIYKHLCNMPAAFVPSYSENRGQRIGETFTLQSYLPTAASSGMSDSAAPHWILQNERTSDYMS